MARCRAQGFSLVEVLVSILVLAAGVIGACGMQLTALRTAQQSGLHTAALQLATDLADRMRSNDDRMRLDDSENPFLDLDYVSQEDAPATATADCFTQHCNAAQLAEFDLRQWQQRIHSALPGGRAVVCRDAAPWDAATKRLTWDCKAEDTGESSLVIKIGWQSRHPDGRLESELDGASAPVIALVVAPYVP